MQKMTFKHTKSGWKNSAKPKKPKFTLTIKIGFEKEHHAILAHDILADCIDKKLRMLDFYMLPAYNPKEVAFRKPTNFKKVAKKKQSIKKKKTKLKK